ncbi:cytochrome c [Shimia isoporae]|uniref:Cytochrome c n=1 Tax=Shimia isoporae TaxID=647720 RepID=A0A4V2Q3R5_9RHOB|nr:c-type cytochrome [Shimia isoporae]TCL08230.1 cytochrome c [Shimia isoporae]
MKTVFALAAATLALAAPAFAEGDVAEGEKNFKKCKACHMIVSPEGEEIYKGGKTGPNLYGVVGRVAGSTDFKYGDGLKEAGEAGFVWTAEELVAYSADPKAWLSDKGFSNKSKMSYKLKKGGEDVVAYLMSVAPAPEMEGGEEEKSE